MASKSTSKAKAAHGNSAAEKISHLRAALGLSKEEFAVALKATRIAVRAWERGDYQPSADACMRIGNLAAQNGDTDGALWFWQRAGMDAANLKRLLPALGKRISEAMASPVDVISVPLLKSLAFVAEPLVAPASEILDRIPLAAGLVANPETTSFLRVSGGSRAAAFREGDLVALDSAERDPSALEGEFVVPIDPFRPHLVEPMRLYRSDGSHILLDSTVADADVFLAGQSVLQRLPRGWKPQIGGRTRQSQNLRAQWAAIEKFRPWYQDSRLRFLTGPGAYEIAGRVIAWQREPDAHRRKSK
jgi:DNA-binding XRE family transcriptional regulator